VSRSVRVMKDKMYKCNKCHTEFHVIGHQFNFCPNCGELYEETITYLNEYFRIIQLSEMLSKVKELVCEGNMSAAVREAIIIFETKVKEESGLHDSVGYSLMTEAFSFQWDQKKKELIKEPRIKVNNLSNQLERDEQEGVKFLAMGLMQGIRNIFMHSKGSDSIYFAMQIITLIDFLLKHINQDGSITKDHGKCCEVFKKINDSNKPVE
jgi:uncharacterized protein (TIGR02391 family)